MTDDEPFVIIKQTGRWWFSVTLHHGVMCLTPSSAALGRKRAERKARRLLADYCRRRQWTGEASRVDL